MAIALHHSKATGAAKLTLIGIGNHDGDGGAWPSIKTLSRYAHTDARATRRQIDKLIELGEIEQVTNGGGSRDTAEHERPNLYRFILECPDNCDKSKNHRICGTCGDPRYSTPRFTCPACKAVENSEKDPLVPQPPPGSPTIPPLVPQPAPPLVPQPAEPSLEPPMNQNSVPALILVSPTLCMACGKPHDGQRRYCGPCITSGLDNPMISCTRCSTARRRERPGEMSFDCGCLGT